MAKITDHLRTAQSLIRHGEAGAARLHLCCAMGAAKSAGHGPLTCWIMNAIKATHAIERARVSA